MRLVMVDDHELIHGGLRQVLTATADIQIVGEGYCGEHFRTLVAQHQPDVVLLDLNMPDMPGARTLENNFNPTTAIRWCHAQYPAVRIVVLSNQIDLSVLNLDVAGYVLKDDLSVPRKLPDLLRAVVAGHKKVSQTIGEKLHSNPLTERQIEILREIAGHPNRTQAEHAEALGMSVSGLKKHLQAIYIHLNVTNLTAAIVVAQWAGYIGSTPPDQS